MDAAVREQKSVSPDDVAWMSLALDEARVAGMRGEVPVGCVLVDPQGRLLARAHNLRETLQDPTGHAELLALRWAAMDRGAWRLPGVTAYVTLEPCPMCAGALVNARVSRVVYGCDDPKAGALRTLFSIGQDVRLNHRFEVTSGVLGDECGETLRRFFALLRARARGRTADK
jgi:tRNA(adenine34) deaminase